MDAGEGMSPDRREYFTCDGRCHCGKVRFEVTLPSSVVASHCNCSICTQSGFVHLIVSRRAFRLLEGASELVEYRFNTRTARHYFCRTCGVKSFYVPRSHPDGYSVNLNCVKLRNGIAVEHEDFDGRNWEKNIARLGQLRN
jgi:hypothetical protein